MSLIAVYTCDGCGKTAPEMGDWITLLRSLTTPCLRYQTRARSSNACSAKCASNCAAAMDADLFTWQAEVRKAKEEKAEHEQSHREGRFK